MLNLPHGWVQVSRGNPAVAERWDASRKSFGVLWGTEYGESTRPAKVFTPAAVRVSLILALEVVRRGCVALYEPDDGSVGIFGISRGTAVREVFGPLHDRWIVPRSPNLEVGVDRSGTRDIA